MKHIFSVVCFTVACFQGLSFARADDATFPIKVPESELVLGSNNNDDSNVSIDTLIDNSLDNFGGSEEGAEEMLVYVLERLAALEEENLALKDKVELVNDLFGSRLTMVETSLAGIEIEGCNCSSGELSDLNRRLSELEASLRGTGTTFPSFTGHGGTYVRPIVPRTEATPETPSTPPTTYLPSSTEYVTEPRLKTTYVPGSDLGHNVLVNSILRTRTGRLVLADRIAKWLFLSEQDSEVYFFGVQLEFAPWALQELPDGTVAVTLEFSHDIAVFNVIGPRLELVRTIRTGADYGGIALGPEEGTLIVAKWRLDSVARLDVINMEGELQRTLLEDNAILIDPYCLRRWGDKVFVSDWTADSFFSVDVHTGEVSYKLGSLDLRDLPLDAPRMFDLDENGTVYLATEASYDVISSGYGVLRVTQAGEWTPMSWSGGFPYGVEISGGEIIVSWTHWYSGWSTTLTAYSLPGIDAGSDSGEGARGSTEGWNENTDTSTFPTPSTIWRWNWD